MPGQSYRDHGGYFNDKWDIKIGGIKIGRDEFTFMSSLVINKPYLEKMNGLTFRAMGYDLVRMASTKGKGILSYDQLTPLSDFITSSTMLLSQR